LKEWAKNTGRWVEGDPEPNYAQLKTRLRCAFNKAPDIEEMKALHVMKCDEPYKVYRFTARRGESFLSAFGDLDKRSTARTDVRS
jgi:Interferon regulatory factor transcription factor